LQWQLLQVKPIPLLLEQVGLERLRIRLQTPVLIAFLLLLLLVVEVLEPLVMVILEALDQEAVL
jgi:hypothetical protein